MGLLVRNPSAHQQTQYGGFGGRAGQVGRTTLGGTISLLRPMRRTPAASADGRHHDRRARRCASPGPVGPSTSLRRGVDVPPCGPAVRQHAALPVPAVRQRRRSPYRGGTVTQPTGHEPARNLYERITDPGRLPRRDPGRRTTADNPDTVAGPVRLPAADSNTRRCLCVDHVTVLDRLARRPPLIRSGVAGRWLWLLTVDRPKGRWWHARTGTGGSRNRRRRGGRGRGRPAGAPRPSDGSRGLTSPGDGPDGGGPSGGRSGIGGDSRNPQELPKPEREGRASAEDAEVGLVRRPEIGDAKPRVGDTRPAPASIGTGANAEQATAQRPGQEAPSAWRSWPIGQQVRRTRRQHQRNGGQGAVGEPKGRQPVGCARARHGPSPR